MDLIITVCDNAAGDACPVWPGRPATAHWGLDDPAAVDGEGQRAAFERTLRLLGARVSALTLLPLESCDAAELRRRLGEIGRMEGSTR
jgi:arsenate reductase